MAPFDNFGRGTVVRTLSVAEADAPVNPFDCFARGTVVRTLSVDENNDPVPSSDFDPHSPGPIGLRADGTAGAGATPGPAAFTTIDATGRGSFGYVACTGDLLVGNIVKLRGAQDVQLVGEAANTLAQRNGTNAQTLEIYGTYTDDSNYERLSVTCDATGIHFASEAAGTGTARPVMFAAPYFVFQTANAGNLGTVGAFAFNIGGTAAGSYPAGSLTTGGGDVLLALMGGNFHVTDGGSGTGTTITKLPTSSAGLTSGTLWNNAGTPAIVP